MELVLGAALLWLAWLALSRGRMEVTQAGRRRGIRRELAAAAARDLALREQNDALSCPLCGVENVPGHSCHVQVRTPGRTVRRP